MSSYSRCERVFGPGVEAAVDDVGEVALERASGFARCLAPGDFAVEERPCAWVDAGLDDRDSVQGRVELPVTPAVETVPV